MQLMSDTSWPPLVNSIQLKKYIYLYLLELKYFVSICKIYFYINISNVFLILFMQILVFLLVFYSIFDG